MLHLENHLTAEAVATLLAGLMAAIPAWVAAAAAVFTVLAAGAALWYAHGQIVEAQKSRDLTRELDIERSQPYVVLFAEASAVSPLFIDLVVRNFGPTAARHVRIHMDPWPSRAWPKIGEKVELPGLIPILAPGQEWRTSWDSSKERIPTDLPDTHIGTVTYEGVRGLPQSTPVLIDWRVFKNRRWMEERGIHDAAVALRDIRTTLKGWNERHTLRVTTRDGDAADSRLRAARDDYFRGQQEDTPGAVSKE